MSYYSGLPPNQATRVYLKAGVRGAWSHPESAQFAMQLSQTLKNSDFAKCLRDSISQSSGGASMKDAIKAAYQNCAQKYNISGTVKGAWG